MKNRISINTNTFGHIYTKFFQSQLKQVGKNLCEIRESRNETAESVADALNLPLGIIIGIEQGARDFKVKELLDLCRHYETDIDAVVKDTGMMKLKIA